MSILLYLASAGAPLPSLPALRALRGGATTTAPSIGSSAPPSDGLLVADASTASSSSSSPALVQLLKDNAMAVSIGVSLLAMLPVLRTLPKKAAITAAVITVALVQMAFDQPPDLVLLEAVIALVGLNVLSMKDALDGFRSEGVVTVGVMTAVAKSIQATGGLAFLSKYLLGNPTNYEGGLLRMILAVMAISAFMNNTPVCAMMMPILASSFATQLGVGPSALLMPLSFATMLGGTLTMIGSSTNLVAANAANGHDPTFNMKVFDISAIGAVNALAGTAYMVLCGRRLLPMGSGAGVKKAPSSSSSKDAAASPAPPRGAFRLWATLGLVTLMMAKAAQAPKALLPMALGLLCVLNRLGCLTLKESWGAINGPVLLSIALSFALGEAIKKSNLASIVAENIVSVVAPYGQLALLFAVYFVAILIGAVISNNAVVALMFPIVVRIFESAGYDWKPGLYALTLAASASFSTPVSYQTNLMVADEAGYSFNDFLKFGLPLQLVCMLATVPACAWLAK